MDRVYFKCPKCGKESDSECVPGMIFKIPCFCGILDGITIVEETTVRFKIEDDEERL